MFSTDSLSPPERCISILREEESSAHVPVGGRLKPQALLLLWFLNFTVNRQTGDLIWLICFSCCTQVSLALPISISVRHKRDTIRRHWMLLNPCKVKFRFTSKTDSHFIKLGGQNLHPHSPEDETWWLLWSLNFSHIHYSNDFHLIRHIDSWFVMASRWFSLDNLKVISVVQWLSSSEVEI